MASDASSLWVAPSVALPLAEIRYEFDPAGGPGGQHVNRSSTRVTLCFDLGATGALTDEQKRRVREALGGRVTAEGLVRVVCGRHRSQARNRCEALRRFRRLMAAALRRTKARRPTRPTRAARERRLAEKKRRAARKRLRGPVAETE